MPIFFSIIVILVLGGLIGWSKYKKYKKLEKYWEGRDPNERIPSQEELRSNESKIQRIWIKWTLAELLVPQFNEVAVFL